MNETNRAVHLVNPVHPVGFMGVLEKVYDNALLIKFGPSMHLKRKHKIW